MKHPTGQENPSTGTTIIVYRDLSDEQRNGFELIGTVSKSGMVVKEQIIPGYYRMPNIYVRHIWEGDLLIISYTNEELTDERRHHILNEGKGFLETND